MTRPIQLPPADLIDQLLDRDLLIGGVAPGINSNVSKYFWELPTGVYPKLIIGLNQLTSDNTVGEPFTRYVFRFRIRLLGGPTGAGATHEMEDNINKNVFGVVNHFMRYRNLQLPDSAGNPRPDQQFLYEEEAKIAVGSQITEFVYGDPNQPSRYIGQDLIQEFAMMVRKQ